MIRNPLRPLFSAACVLALLALAEKPLSAGSMDPSLPVSENRLNIGTIDIHYLKNDEGKIIGVEGDFKVNPNLKDPETGNPMTLSQLAKSKKLGENHFNWLQDVRVNKDVTITSLKDPSKPDDGTVTHKYKAGQTIIDPQSGGQDIGGGKSGIWADAKPWYYSEGGIPEAFSGGKKQVKSTDGTEWEADPELQLSARASKFKLGFQDAPEGKNETYTFSTFLVSVGNSDPKKPQNGYKVLAGFSWSITFDADGKPTVKLDTVNGGKNLKRAEFTQGINDEINSQGFGKWTPAKGSIPSPEPSTLILLASGLIGTVPFGLRRCSQRQHSAARR